MGLVWFCVFWESVVLSGPKFNRWQRKFQGTFHC